MNIVDIAVIMLFAFFLLSGWYRGFINTLLSLGAFVLACACAFLFHPLVSNAIKSNETLYTMALYYTEGSEFVAGALTGPGGEALSRSEQLMQNVELANTPVSGLSSAQINAVLENSDISIPMDTRIAQNVATEVFAPDGLVTLGEYFNQTIVNVIINIVSVLVLFAAFRLVFSFVIHLVDYARRGFPMIQTTDGLIGAGFGLIRGFFSMYVFFLIVPVVLTVLPSLKSYIDESFFGTFFYNTNFMLRMIPG